MVLAYKLPRFSFFVIKIVWYKYFNYFFYNISEFIFLQIIIIIIIIIITIFNVIRNKIHIIILWSLLWS